MLEFPQFRKNQESILFLSKKESTLPKLPYYYLTDGASSKFDIIFNKDLEEKEIIRDLSVDYPIYFTLNGQLKFLSNAESAKLRDFTEFINNNKK